MKNNDLINLRAKHNFISKDLVQNLRLSVTKTSTYGIIMGIGDSVSRKGVCLGVVLHLQGIDIMDDFLPPSLGSSNVILGI